MGVLGSVGYGGYMYYKDTQQRIAILTENNATLEVAAQLQEETINTMIEDVQRNSKLNRVLQKELQVAEQYGDELRNTLRKHNLTHLANKKPGLIERKMQNATNRLWDDLADITNPNGVQPDTTGKGSDGNKDSENGNTDNSKAKASPAK